MDRHITAGTRLDQSPLPETRAWQYVSKTKPQQPHVTVHTILTFGVFRDLTIHTTTKFWAARGYAHAPFCPELLVGFCSHGPCECTGQILSP